MNRDFRHLTALACLAASWAGCALTQNRPHTTLDVGAAYGYLQGGESSGSEHHQYGISSRLHHDSGDGLLAGLFLGYLEGQNIVSEFMEPSVTTSYSMAMVTPYFGFDSRYVAFEIGMGLLLSHDTLDLRVFPMPFLTFRAGHQEKIYFEAVTGPERGVWDGTLATVGLGARMGEREQILIRAAVAVTTRFSRQGSARTERGIFSFDDDDVPLGALVEFTWTGPSGVGVYARAVGAKTPTIVIGMAFDLPTLIAKPDA